MNTNESFEDRIVSFWGVKFEVPQENIKRNSTCIIDDSVSLNDNKIIIYDFTSYVIIRAGKQAIESCKLSPGFIANTLINAQAIETKINSNNLKIKESYTLFDFFLNPPDFIASTCNPIYRTSILDPEKDRDKIDELLGLSSSEDIENADILIDELDPVNFGVFNNNEELVAYSSYRIFGENICDVGVLVHPDYRGQGLGKTVVTPLCQYCIKNSIIPMYRVFEDNKASIRIPESLGFDLLLSVHTIKF